jgi:hypothetical protein
MRDLIWSWSPISAVALLGLRESVVLEFFTDTPDIDAFSGSRAIGARASPKARPMIPVMVGIVSRDSIIEAVYA